jgi:hypothetical protein
MYVEIWWNPPNPVWKSVKGREVLKECKGRGELVQSAFYIFMEWSQLNPCGLSMYANKKPINI